ncbi:helix-turn-helix domain-containing protein [Corynebacterium casei]|uniref:helix-turn-helix domain-containing protein n=1 Tax=Corynebacterium casei TaxID=160386 RepID=UPI003FD58D58
MNQDKSESTSARYRRLQEEWRKAVRASELVPAAKLVLHALQDYQMQKRGTAWPGQGTLAEECGLSRRTVASALKSGREAGFIVPVGSESKGGRYGSVVYAFEIPGDPVQPVTFGTNNRVKHTAHGEGDRVKQAAQGKGSPCAIQCTDRVKQAAHKPPIEPPKDITPKNNKPNLTEEQMNILMNMPGGKRQ